MSTSSAKIAHARHGQRAQASRWLALLSLAALLLRSAPALGLADPWPRRVALAPSQPVSASPLADEDQLLGPDGAAQLWQVVVEPAAPTSTQAPLILVHGIKDDPASLHDLIDRYAKDPQTALFVLAYDDFHRLTSKNARDFAAELRQLAQHYALARLSIVAHSLGGIVTWAALSEFDSAPLAFSQVRFAAIDSPWHGFDGPSDWYVGIWKAMMSKVLPAGIVDVRTGSDLLNGSEEHKGIYSKGLPNNVDFFPWFAAQGDEALDYSEKAMGQLPRLYADFWSTQRVPRMRADQWHLFRILHSAKNYEAFAAEAAARQRTEGPQPELALQLMTKYFPRLAGNHTTVLETIGKGNVDLFELRTPPPLQQPGPGVAQSGAHPAAVHGLVTTEPSALGERIAAAGRILQTAADPAARFRAVQDLSRLAPTTAGDQPGLPAVVLRACADPEPAVRAVGLSYLASATTSPVFFENLANTDLDGLLNATRRDRDPATRALGCGVVAALAGRASQGRRQTLQRVCEPLLADAVPLVRAMAAAAVVPQPTPESLTALRKMLNDRAAAVWTVRGPRGVDGKPVQLPLRALADQPNTVAYAAALALMQASNPVGHRGGFYCEVAQPGGANRAARQCIHRARRWLAGR